MPDARQPAGADIVRRRHVEWQQHCVRYRWLLDSLEGGQRYRDAVYGQDRRGYPVRNLVRHKREYDDPRESSGVEVYPSVHPADLGAGPGQTPSLGDADAWRNATDGDYEMRRARTPIPTFVKEAVENDLSQIYAREVRRVAPDSLTAWWGDVDGSGTPIDRWMKETVGPLLMTLGGLDLIFDHPPAPADAKIVSVQDRRNAGLDRCVADFILPENMLWWKLDHRGRYVECLVREVVEDDEGKPVEKLRHWTATDWTLYDPKGAVEASDGHPFGRVPIVRVFDRRKFRCNNVPQSRYESVAEYQREYYNRDSELILSDTTQAHPLLQGPEDYIQSDGTLPIGPSWLLPKKKPVAGSSGGYEGFEVIQFGKEGAASIRLNKNDIREAVDRDAKLLRPAGSHAVEKGTVEQSAISKQIDYQPAHNRLAQIADTLERCEKVATEFAAVVLGDGSPSAGEVEIVYPQSFDLYTASETTIAVSDFQNICMRTGLPDMQDVEKAFLKRQVRLAYPGLPDASYAQFDADIDKFIDAGGGLKVLEEQAASAMQAKIRLDPAGGVRNTVNDPTARTDKPNTPVKPRPAGESPSG